MPHPHYFNSKVHEILEVDLAWLAGLLEGEGSFLPGPPSAPNATRIQCSMCDEDIIARVAEYLQATYHEIRKRQPHHKRAWFVTIKGSRARELMVRLRPLMGSRRQGQIDKALASPSPGRYKITSADLPRIYSLLDEGWTHKAIAAQYGVERSHISHLKSKRHEAS